MNSSDGSVLEGLEKDAREAKKAYGPIRSRDRRGSGVGIESGRSKEMFMSFRKSSVSSSLPSFLDRLRKRCVKVHLRFPTVFFGSEF